MLGVVPAGPIDVMPILMVVSRNASDDDLTSPLMSSFIDDRGVI
jgi:hypothetical protein